MPNSYRLNELEINLPIDNLPKPFIIFDNLYSYGTLRGSGKTDAGG